MTVFFEINFEINFKTKKKQCQSFFCKIDLDPPDDIPGSRHVSYFLNKTRVVYQGLHRLEKYLNIPDCLEKSLKINFALKST